MKRFFVFLCAVMLVLGMVGSASADPITVDFYAGTTGWPGTPDMTHGQVDLDTEDANNWFYTNYGLTFSSVYYYADLWWGLGIANDEIDMPDYDDGMGYIYFPNTTDFVTVNWVHRDAGDIYIDVFDASYNLIDSFHSNGSGEGTTDLTGSNIACMRFHNDGGKVGIKTLSYDYDPCADLGGDTDGDEVCDDNDNCINTPNAGQEDSDIDGIGDVCDNCLDTANFDQLDSDSDSIGDLCDNCPEIKNVDQADNDGDEQGDVCDPDDDNDGLLDEDDNCPFVENSDQADFDGDGVGDACDGDDDGDGIIDNEDLCPGTTLGVSVDEHGCSGEQNVDLACPCDGNWKNHGKYVSCVAHAAEDQLAAGLITQAEKGVIVSARAKSGCGKKK
jgi:hypothetical protein